MKNLTVNEIIKGLEKVVEDLKQYTLNNKIETRSRIYDIIEDDFKKYLKNNIFNKDIDIRGSVLWNRKLQRKRSLHKI